MQIVEDTDQSQIAFCIVTGNFTCIRFSLKITCSFVKENLKCGIA